MNTTINRQQWQEEEALRRFQLISPLLQTGLDDAKRIQLRKKIAEENNISVRSLYRYEKAFSERQFTGLKPADREKHRSQKLPENFSFLLEQAIQLRKEVPERSVAQIIYILETEGLAVPGTLKRSTLERHIYKIGVHELWKESYNFRAVRRADKLYLFVDGRELGALDIRYPASRIGFCSEGGSPVYSGTLYYHVGQRRD